MLIKLVLQQKHIIVNNMMIKKWKHLNLKKENMIRFGGGSEEL